MPIWYQNNHQKPSNPAVPFYFSGPNTPKYQNTGMEIELSNIREDVYANFLDFMKSSETRRTYVRNLKKSLNFIQTISLKNI